MSAALVVAALQRVASIYAVDLSQQRIVAYLDVLLPEADAQALAEGIRTASRTCRFFPTPAEILDACGQTKAHRASVAWSEVVATASSGRRSHQDPAIQAAVRLVGGWEEIARCDRTKLPFIQRRFEEIFEPTSLRISTQQGQVLNGQQQRLTDRDQNSLATCNPNPDGAVSDVGSIKANRLVKSA